MKTQFLSRSTLWGTIKKLAKKTKTRRMIAAPYIGKGSAKFLPLRKGDVLICALTEANAKDGSVCPSEIKILQERGIKIYVRENLHAKIYLFGRGAVVGSANLSQSSISELDEAGILTSDPQTICSIRKWFDLRMNKPITPKWLAHCQKLYKPPQIVRGKQPSHPASRVWMVGVHSTEFPTFEERAEQQGYAIARKRLRQPRMYNIERIRWTGTGGFVEAAKRGDSIIQVWNKNKKYSVCPHGTLLHKKKTKTKAGGVATYLYIELPKDYRMISWTRFKESCREFGLEFKSTPASREIKKQVLIDDLLALVSPERLMRQ